ncbi:Uncharacterised protein [Chlamydia trachomatis]|nr:Uncharacterised protein [Chlamydia trachomatis]
MEQNPCSINSSTQGTSVSLIREDFPEPETPVTTVICPNGIETVRSLRLCLLALDKVIVPKEFVRLAGTEICCS